MKCPHCNGEIDDQQTNGDEGTTLGLWPETRSTGGTHAVQGSPACRTRRAQRSRLAPDWTATHAQRAYCERQGKDPDAFQRAFIEYYQAKGTLWLDWNKVWQKACRDWKGHPEAHTAPPERESVRERELSQWRARLSSARWNPFWGPPVGEPGCMVPRELLP